jgi:hypothetical protein
MKVLYRKRKGHCPLETTVYGARVNGQLSHPAAECSSNSFLLWKAKLYSDISQSPESVHSISQPVFFILVSKSVIYVRFMCCSFVRSEVFTGTIIQIIFWAVTVGSYVVFAILSHHYTAYVCVSYFL